MKLYGIAGLMARWRGLIAGAELKTCQTVSGIVRGMCLMEVQQRLGSAQTQLTCYDHVFGIDRP